MFIKPNWVLIVILHKKLFKFLTKGFFESLCSQKYFENISINFFIRKEVSPRTNDRFLSRHCEPRSARRSQTLVL
jgi:hypothetical protein